MVKIALTKYLPESIDIYEDHLNISMNKAIITKIVVARCAVINSHSLKTHYCWHYRMLSGARRYVTWHDPDNAILLNTILWTHTLPFRSLLFPNCTKKLSLQFIVARRMAKTKLCQENTKTKIDGTALVHLQPFPQSCSFSLRKISSGFALWIQIRNFQSPKWIPTKIGAYPDSTMIDHRCLLNLIGASIFHHFTTGGIGNDTRRSISLNWSMNLFFTNHQFPNNCAHCNVSRWCH